MLLSFDHCCLNDFVCNVSPKWNVLIVAKKLKDNDRCLITFIQYSNYTNYCV